MVIIRVVLGVLGLVLIAACIWAFQAGHFLNEFQSITALPWGKVSLIDLYLGFFAFAVVFFVCEPIWLAALLTLLMMTLGNWVPAFWLIWKLPMLIKKLGRAS